MSKDEKEKNKIIDQFVGRKIEQLRVARGLTQQQLADVIEYESATAISHFERGERSIRAQDLTKLAAFFCVPISHFFPQTDKQTSSEKKEEFVLKLRANYEKLDKRVVDSINDFAMKARKKFSK